MKRYNYYTVKGREEIIKEENDWYNAKEVDKERANDKKEIEQLKKEKEWFIDKVVDSYKYKYENKSVAEIKEILLTVMKEMLKVIEVLKEEKDGSKN